MTEAVELRVDSGRLVAGAMDQSALHRASALHVRYTRIGHERVAVLSEPVAFFIPEHVPDPSRRQQGAQLWVEATIPKQGLPRPIRLGVKKDDGPIVPLDLH